MVAQPILGIDIGGSGIKGALVDVALGSFLSERLRLPTPQPARLELVSRAVADLVQQFAWHGPIGCTFPAIIKRGVALRQVHSSRSCLAVPEFLCPSRTPLSPFAMHTDTTNNLGVDYQTS